MGNDESGFFDTRCAARYLGLSHRTLDGYRVSGDGPAFHRFGKRVRYGALHAPTSRTGCRFHGVAERIPPNFGTSCAQGACAYPTTGGFGSRSLSECLQGQNQPSRNIRKSALYR